MGGTGVGDGVVFVVGGGVDGIGVGGGGGGGNGGG